MENYYLLVAICCLLPFIVGGIIFGSKDKKMEQSPKLRMSSAQVGQKPEDLMFREYSSDVFGNHLLQKLKKHCDDDAWFLEATPQLMHDGDCLAYINEHEHLAAMFWENIQKLRIHADRDERFQRLVFSIHRTSTGRWTPNFITYRGDFRYPADIFDDIIEEMQYDDCFPTSKLVERCLGKPEPTLFYEDCRDLVLDYGRRYELLPDILFVIKTDNRFLQLRNGYKYARYEQSVH